MEMAEKKIEGEKKPIMCSHDTGLHPSVFPRTDNMIPGFLKLTLCQQFDN